jgi:uncharacterized protein (DUF885 family)
MIDNRGDIGMVIVRTLVILLLLPTAMLANPAAESKLQAIIADFSAYDSADDPFTAAAEGDVIAASRLPDVSPEADARRKAALARFQARLQVIKPASLSSDSVLNRDLLARTIEDRLQAIHFDNARMPFVNDSGFHTALLEAATTVAIRDRADADAWIHRLEGADAFYDANIANLRRGIATGFLQPRLIAQLIADQARQQAEQSLENHALLAPLAQLPSNIPAEVAEELRFRARRVIEETVLPAERRFADFMRNLYLPATRDDLAARDLPDGAAYYSWLVAHHTTTSLTPEAIHQLGLSEVLRIRQAMQQTMHEAGFQGTLKEFLAMLRSDPRFTVNSRQALLEKASEIAKRIDDQLPRHFGRLPRLPYGVRPVPAEIEENYTTGRYFPGSPQLGVAGGLMINTSHLDQRPLYELPALALHEGVPGHHLQIALAQELMELPSFRRNAPVTAFVEGWGLYAEQLGYEMGIYRDAYEKFGQLSYEMWRACRLVADTGIHWLGWSREQATACFEDNTALSSTNIANEVLRYIAWPGQALAYKIGELKLMELRQRAEAKLGQHFDERAFHDEILLAGPLPLDLLEARFEVWLSGQKR